MREAARRIAAVLGAAWGALAMQAAHGAMLHIESDEDLLEAAYGDRSVIRLATGQRQTVRRAPAVARVVTAADIAAMGARDLSAAPLAPRCLRLGVNRSF